MGLHQSFGGAGLQRQHLVQAQALRRAFREHGHDPAAFALGYDEATEREAAPFYWNQISADRIRVAEIAALVELTADDNVGP